MTSFSRPTSRRKHTSSPASSQKRVRAPLPRIGVALVAFGLLAAFALPAAADTLNVNDIVTNGDTSLAVGATGTGYVYNSVASNDPAGDVSGCNATGNDNVVVELESSSAAVTLAVASVTLSGCGPTAKASFGYAVVGGSAGDVVRIYGNATGGKSGSLFNNDLFRITILAPAAPLLLDTLAPELTVPADITTEATSASGATVTFSASAWDATDGALAATCLPASGSVFPLGTTEVACSATDAAGNTGDAFFDVTVEDTTAPVVTASGNIAAASTSPSGATVTIPAATWNDAVDGAGSASCDHATGTFPIGVTTVACSHTDAAGNLGSASFTVTVSDFGRGFHAPVDMAGTLNALKGGSSVPMKFSVYTTAGEVTDPAAIRMTIKTTACPAGAAVDEVETPNTSSTSLRYDAAAGQFVYNWQSPKLANTCYSIGVDHDRDAATPNLIAAQFRTK